MSIEAKAEAIAKRQHGFQTVKASDVAVKSIEWLWPGRIARGCINIIAGPGGLGKSMVAMSIAASVTQGRALPFTNGSATKAGEVFWLTGEEGMENQLKPRAMAAGANLDLLHFIEGVHRPGETADIEGGAMVRLSLDADQLPALKREYPNTQLLIIDPLSAFLDARDQHKEADVRQVLTPWVKAAEESGVAVVFIAHHNKGQGNVRDRLSGSSAIRNTARIVHAVMEDAGNKEERYFLLEKNNLSDTSKPGLVFKVEGRKVADGEIAIPAAAVTWVGETQRTADDLAKGGGVASSALGEAMEFLKDFVQTHGPSPFDEIVNAGEAAGLSERTLRRAKSALGVKSRKDGPGGTWRCHLEKPAPSTNDVASDSKLSKHGPWPSYVDCRVPGGLKPFIHADQGGLSEGGQDPVEGCSWPSWPPSSH